MLHDQCGSDRVQRKCTHEVGRIKFAPTLLWTLSLIMEKSRGINHQPDLTACCSKSCGALQAGLVK